MFNQVARKTVTLASAVAMLAGCAKGGGTFSTLADSASFKQEATYVPKKIDILWIIDNSGSMATSQANLASNFQAFIARFNQTNNDFHMAVGTTDAWMKQFGLGGADIAKIRDGSGSNHSGVFVMDKNTPNLSSVFQTNIKQGIYGNGDERAFESIKQIINEPWNAGFRRPDAFLAVIIVSDEEDQSSSQSSFYEGTHPTTYLQNPNLYSVQSYIDLLDAYTGGTANGRNYSVSNISIHDQACLTQLSNDSSRKINVRYQQITDMTGGIQGSLCDDFGNTLNLISDNIIQLSSVFKLSREPIAETIVVTVDGAVVAQDATNGWTYDASNLTITFHGSSVPGANSTVKINFDPKTIQL
ncbi:MAG: hypothetical protein ACM3MG_13190 [Bacillota bacterium]